MLTIEFTTKHAYEETEENNYFRNEEIKRVLKNICNQIDNGKTSGDCIGTNGSKVGEWELT